MREAVRTMDDGCDRSMILAWHGNSSWPDRHSELAGLGGQSAASFPLEVESFSLEVERKRAREFWTRKTAVRPPPSEDATATNAQKARTLHLWDTMV